MVRRTLPFAMLAALLAALALAAPASARRFQMTLKEGPFVVGPYSVKIQTGAGIKTPKLDGFITRMQADVVDVRTGKPVPIQRIMLHHIVFAKVGVPSAGVAGIPGIEPFYGDGEERAKMDLPRGYGYPIAKADAWGWTWMLMNHRWMADRVYVRYRMTIDTDPSLTAVKPIVWDTSHGRPALVFDVPGGGRPGSLDVRTDTNTMPQSGRLVAGLGHVHGGAKDLALSQPTCGNRTIYRSRPTWGLPSNAFYKVRPVLHEPGPIDMSRFRSARGIPVVKGQPIRLTSRYDDSLPHTRAMGLLLAYLAPDDSVTNGCAPMPADLQTIRTSVPGRTKAPVRRISIYDWTSTGRAARVAGPPGRVVRVAGATADVKVGEYFFRAGNLSVPRGAKVTWTFSGAERHNVTVANGPEGFSSDRLQGGKTFTKVFTRPGTYSFFCELHPVGMIERVVVRPR